MNMPNEILQRLIFCEPAKSAEREYTRVKEIVHEPKPCEDCGRLKAGRKVHSKLMRQPTPHWRHHCLGCRKIKNPETGEWDLRIGDYNAFIKDYMNRL